MTTQYAQSVELSTTDVSLITQQIDIYNTNARANIVFLDRLKKGLSDSHSSQADLHRFYNIMNGDV